ncbi:MAG: DPP IV N-terminal domain-containing protein [Fimbriimonadaceae bacterium]|nr:DPP IV N-terminal domain-containing protein [Fimbriimonadaceae bacterium]
MHRSVPVIIAIGLAVFVAGQDRLSTMPRYDRYEKLRREIAGSVAGGTQNVVWDDGAPTFTFSKDGKRWRYDARTQKVEETSDEPAAAPTGRRPGGRGPARGRQFDSAISPDGKLKAFHRDRNLYLSDADGKNETPVTTDGNSANRVKYGIASWVYGEELGVNSAIWWSPDGKKVAFYRFDEAKVKDYFLAMNVTRVQNGLDVEPYPKAGAENPVAEILVYDLATKTATKVETHPANEPFEGMGHYVYDVRWADDSSELLFNRTNRTQNAMEFCAANPDTGACRVVIRETSATGWVENSPLIRYVDEAEAGTKRRFLWASERTGFRNLYLYDMTGKLINPVTQHPFEIAGITKVDAKSGRLWYTARSAPNPYLLQLHRVGLDGKGDRRLTDPTLSHRPTISSKGDFFVDQAESVSSPPVTKLFDGDGKEVATLAEADATKFKALGLQPVERIAFTAADGVTVCYGTLEKPSDFDPSKKYPLLVSVYGGPESGQTVERFATPNAITEMGFLVAWFDGRGTNGRGAAFRHAVYRKLGVVEIDDQAAGVRELAKRPYVDASRVGVFGTSYGGYASVMAILRYPDVFHAAVASSPVTAWENYDSIYTERYMDTPQNNPEGYKAGSAMPYARNLKGRLMLFYGTADNNVHPANTYQLAQALQRAGKSFDMMAGPDQGHSGINATRMWEYFVDALVLAPKPNSLARVYNARKREIAKRR